MEQPLSSILANSKLSSITIPLVATKEAVYNFLIKYLQNIMPDVYIVSWEESNNSSMITYDKLLEYVAASNNTLFIIDDPKTFSMYGGEIVNYQLNNNSFFVIIDVLTEKQDILDLYEIYPSMITFWPSPLNLDVEMITETKITYISGKQMERYSKIFLEYRKSISNNYFDEKPREPRDLLGALNVYFDGAINSLENQTLDTMFLRAPKFRSIMLDILLKNKKRHFINMIDGRYGINSFEVLYNKIPNLPAMIVIRSNESYQVKLKKIREFNSNNSPLILLSDFSFTKELTPKNIDFFHITSGGEYDNIISILSCIKGINYTGSYPRKFHIYSHVAKAANKDVTIDIKNNKQFENKLYQIKNRISGYKNLPKIYLKGDELFSSISDV